VNLLRTSKKIRSIILGDYLIILVAIIPPKLEFKLVSASSSRLDYISKTLVYTVDKAQLLIVIKNRVGETFLIKALSNLVELEAPF